MKLSSAYIEDRFDENYSDIYRNSPDVDATVEQNWTWNIPMMFAKKWM